MIQDKAQCAENGRPFSRTATPDWLIWVAPCGRAGKRPSVLLRLLARAGLCRRDAPRQLLPALLYLLHPCSRSGPTHFLTRCIHQYDAVGVLGLYQIVIAWFAGKVVMINY
jgi:hypothetical protein